MFDLLFSILLSAPKAWVSQGVWSGTCWPWVQLTWWGLFYPRIRDWPQSVWVPCVSASPSPAFHFCCALDAVM